MRLFIHNDNEMNPWVQIDAAQLSPDNIIILCAICGRAAIEIDNFYPYHQEYCRCKSHVGMAPPPEIPVAESDLRAQLATAQAEVEALRNQMKYIAEKQCESLTENTRQYDRAVGPLPTRDYYCGRVRENKLMAEIFRDAVAKHPLPPTDPAEDET